MYLINIANGNMGITMDDEDPESGTHIVLTESQQRFLVVWLVRNRTQIIREIVCEECPEHIGEMERKAYVMNECERGHRA